MTAREIEELLQRYYEGATSLKEEHLLKEYFLRPGVPGRLAEHRSVFRYFVAGAKEGVSAKFDETLKEKIGTDTVISMRPSRNRLVITLSIAATVTLIAALATLFRIGIFSPSQPYGTVTDPDLAYAEVRSALYMVSSRLNGGLDRAHRLGTFSTGLEKMGKFNQLEKYQPVIINHGRNQNTRP